MKIIFRTLLFFLSIMIFLASGMFLISNRRLFRALFFRSGCLSIKIFFKALGLKIIGPNLHPEKPQGYTLYIANHDSIMDGLFLMAYLRLRTVVEGGIKNVSPILGYYSRYFEHVIVDEGDRKSEAVALYQALKTFETYHRFAIFPSAGIRPIDRNFSQGAYFLAKKLNADVVPLFLFYKPKRAFLTIPFQTDMQFVLQSILHGNRTMICEAGETISIEQFKDDLEFKEHIQSLYKQRIYQDSMISSGIVQENNESLSEKTNS